MLQQKDFSILDSIRGIASLYVVIAHCRGLLWIGGNEFVKQNPQGTWDVWDYAVLGTSMLTRVAVEFVILFFVLSGFSIAHSLSANKSVKQFYLRRFIRIYPSYIIALVWAAIIFVLTKQWYPEWYNGSMTTFAYERSIEMNNFFSLPVVLGNVFYMADKGYVTPFWSLTYEVIFYVFAPFMLRNVSVYAVISVLLFVTALLLPSKTESLVKNGYIYNFLFVYNIYFVAGVLLYKYYNQVSAVFSRFSNLHVFLLIAVTTIGMYGMNIYFKIETAYSFLFSALLGVILILYFLRNQIRIEFLMWVGKFSYTLYITHFATIFLYLAIFYFFFKYQYPHITNFFVWMPAILFCLLIAFIHYLLIESKTKHILNSLRKRKADDIFKRKALAAEENIA